MCCTVSSPVFATQTPLGPAAIAPGWFPTLIGFPTTRFTWVLMRSTVPSEALTTHTSEPVDAIATGSAPTGISRTTM
jgi:hypothetical protein